MEKTPNALRKHVVLLGEVNVGKSTLFNALTGQDTSIVSCQPGTTTDPVRAAMELIPYGPIVIIDTAGLGDSSELGDQRMQKTFRVLRRADAVIYVAEAQGFSEKHYGDFLKHNLPHLLVFTGGQTDKLQEEYPDAIFYKNNIDAVREQLSALLSALEPEDESLLGGLLPAESNVIAVIPVDSEAPKGRLILPQVQLLRDCLDHGIKCLVTKVSTLESALASFSPVNLVVTDSQAFSEVDKILPREIPLTSFSLLLARQKGNFAQLMSGAEAITALPENARVLMLEGCTHNHTHEDIGRTKIPALLASKTGKHFQYDYFSGYDFPDDLSPYALAIQCGGCMLGKREITSRLSLMANAHLPVTNYGIALAWASGTWARCRDFFIKGETNAS